MTAPVKRTIIVTGASRGLGKAIALRFGEARERIVVAFRLGENEARAVADEIVARGGEGVSIRADVRDPRAVEELVRTALRRWGGIDVLVNNAGITRDGLAVRLTERDWDDVLDTGLKGPFLCIREVSRTMMNQRGGHIINISSISAVHGRAGQANYSAAKAGLIGLTKTAAKELGRYDIKVNAVLPGYLNTAMGNMVDRTVADGIMRDNALGRISDPGEVAEFVYRLSLMSNVSGQVFNLDSRIL